MSAVLKPFCDLCSLPCSLEVCIPSPYLNHPNTLCACLLSYDQSKARLVIVADGSHLSMLFSATLKMPSTLSMSSHPSLCRAELKRLLQVCNGWLQICLTLMTTLLMRLPTATTRACLVAK